MFPSQMLREFDFLIAPHLGLYNDHYIFEDLLNPSTKLLNMYAYFCKHFSTPFKVGRNIIEIGTGCGGLSYVAKRAGFDVISTDIGMGMYEEAGAMSRKFLGIEPVEFTVSLGHSISAIMRFRNKRKSNYIYIVDPKFKTVV